MARKSRPPQVLTSGPTSVEHNGKTYTGTFTHYDDGWISVSCAYGSKPARALAGLPGRSSPQGDFASTILREIIEEAEAKGRLRDQ